MSGDRKGIFNQLPRLGKHKSVNFLENIGLFHFMISKTNQIGVVDVPVSEGRKLHKLTRKIKFTYYFFNAFRHSDLLPIFYITI